LDWPKAAMSKRPIGRLELTSANLSANNQNSALRLAVFVGPQGNNQSNCAPHYLPVKLTARPFGFPLTSMAHVRYYLALRIEPMHIRNSSISALAIGQETELRSKNFRPDPAQRMVGPTGAPRFASLPGTGTRL
jgi:hypothetical protein